MRFTASLFQEHGLLNECWVFVTSHILGTISKTLCMCVSLWKETHKSKHPFNVLIYVWASESYTILLNVTHSLVYLTSLGRSHFDTHTPTLSPTFPLYFGISSGLFGTWKPHSLLCFSQHFLPRALSLEAFLPRLPATHLNFLHFKPLSVLWETTMVIFTVVTLNKGLLSVLVVLLCRPFWYSSLSIKLSALIVWFALLLL